MKGPATPSSPAHRSIEIDALRDAIEHIAAGGAGHTATAREALKLLSNA